MADIASFTLNNNTKIPSVGMGCWMGEPGQNDRAYEMCKHAVNAGYRHFDTASGYGNEEAVGRALKESGVPRAELYITTKLGNSDHHQVREAFEKSLKALDCEYIDMYLVHWPQAVVDGKTLQPTESPTVVDTWKEMEKLLDTGKVKSIGISNFGIPLVEQLLKEAKVVPATNQVEVHPYLPYHDLQAFCKSKGILLTAYSPLGQSSKAVLEDPTLLSIAEKHQATAGQVALSWGVQRGIIVIPKSENPERMKANLKLVKLSEEEVETINNIHKNPGMHKSLLSYHKDGGVFGWKYEQMGWNMTTGGIVKQ